MTTKILHGDSSKVLAELPDASVDAVITDPPYEISFMSKTWDGSGIAYNVSLWAECLRVLKPGGHLLAFGGTRTYHRMVCAIEDAGFEIRDSIHWLYGSGFPKSLDVSKAIDKAAGAQREVVGTSRGVAVASSDNQYGGINRGAVGIKQVGIDVPVTAPATDAARQWSGWGTALKPAHEPIVVARKPLVGTVAGNVLAHGTGALNIDGCRVGFASEADEQESKAKNQHADFGTEPGGNAVYGDYSMVPAKNYNPPGRWPANIVLTHAADCGEACAEGCPVAELDGQSGHLHAAGSRSDHRNRSPFTSGSTDLTSDHAYVTDSGGASRFFTVTEWDPIADVAPFRYVAKPSKRERNAGLDGLEAKREADRTKDDGAGGDNPRNRSNTAKVNHHPTVKPVALMRWLVRLVTPPGGTVLDPFAGSGTTLVAAVLEGFEAIGIEMIDDYLPIIEGRIAWANTTKLSETQTLFSEEETSS